MSSSTSKASAFSCAIEVIVGSTPPRSVHGGDGDRAEFAIRAGGTISCGGSSSSSSVRSVSRSSSTSKASAFKREKQQLHRMSMDSSMEPSSVQCNHCNGILCDITEYQQHFFALHQ